MKGSVGARIKWLRERRNWSQLDLEEKTGINNSVLSRIEKSKRPVQAEELRIFADVFNVSADYLLGRTNDPNLIHSTKTVEFIEHLELTDDDLLKKFQFSYKGMPLAYAESLEFISIARAIFDARKSLKQKP